MLEELVVKNLNRFEVVLNAQLGNIDRRGKYLELKLIYVRGGLVLVRSSIVIVIIIGPIVILLLLILLVVIILIQRFPARHSQGLTWLPFHWRLLGVSSTEPSTRLARRFRLKWSGCFPVTEIVIFFPWDFIFKVE